MFQSSRSTLDRSHRDADPKLQRDVFLVSRKSWSRNAYVVESEGGEALF